MSDYDNEKKPKRPQSAAAADDPWGKWRAPGAAAAPARSERPARAERPQVERPVVERAVAAPAVNPEIKAETRVEKPVVPIVRERPTGTLSPIKAPEPVRAPAKKPYKNTSTAAGKTPWSRERNEQPSRGPAREARPERGPAWEARPERERRPERESRDFEARNFAEVRSPKPAPAVRSNLSEGVRLSKVMSERGMCSRREADLWIERGWVLVDGVRVSELGSRVSPEAVIVISKDAEKDQAKQVTVLLNKPIGYVSGQPEPGCTPAITLITAANQIQQSGDPQFKPWMLRGLAPAGRLDIDSTGLLILTQDGRVAKKLIGEDSQAEKEYLVRVSGEMIPGGLQLLKHGLSLDDKPLKPAWVKQLNEDQLHFILKEGKKRQIRRMCELVGLQVIGLKRVRIGRVKLGDLPMGQWRFLRADEAF